MATPTKSQLSPHAVIGVVVCLLGILFTLDNLNFVDAGNFFHYWPLIPIGFGLLFLMQANEAEEWGRGALWLAFGGVFLARSMGYLPFNPFALWPLLLVLVGIKLMWGARAMDCDDWRMRRRDRHQRRQTRWNERLGHAAEDPDEWHRPADAGGTAGLGRPGSANEPPLDPWAPFPTEPPVPPAQAAREPWTKEYHASFAPGSGTVQPPPIPNLDDEPAAPSPGAGGRTRGGWSGGHPSNSRVTLFALMSGVTRRVQGLFRGGQLTAIMGGLELDLRGAHLEDVAVIDTLAFWGGIEIYVPEDWVVVNQGFALMGGFDDSTKSPLPGNRPHLIVRGLALMGGIEIKVKKKEYWWKGK